MTLNVVLKAKGDRAVDRSGVAITCAEIARRWLVTSDWTFTGEQLAAKLTAPGGPLDLVTSDNVERIETNLQIAHAPKSAVRDFRTDYLMNVFDYDARSEVFAQAPMEDQIDRDRLLADASLRQAFKTWLLDPQHFSELDRGTLVIPPEFLAKSAIAPTPVGFAVSNLQPEFGLVQGDEGTADPLFSEHDVVTAWKSCRAGHAGAEHPLGRGVRTPAQRHHLRGMPSDPRHRWLSFSGRRLDAEESVELDLRTGLAAFLRRPDQAARYPDGHTRGPNTGLFPRIFEPGRNCGAARNLPVPHIKTAGARIAISQCRARRTTT